MMEASRCADDGRAIWNDSWGRDLTVPGKAEDDRYVAVGKGVVRDGVEIRYAAMAPSTILRFDPGTPWHYGLKNRPRYSAGLTDAQILRNLTSRKVFRVCGTRDVKVFPFCSLDSCLPAMLQGRSLMRVI